LNDLEANFLAFLEGLETVHLDSRKVCKQILTAFVGRNESETFRVVEPLDRTSCHTNFPCNSKAATSPRKAQRPRIAVVPPHKLTNGIFSYKPLVEKSASLIVESLYSSVKKILRRPFLRCKEPISRVFPAFLMCGGASGAS
jgi:hypothetical protein